MPGIFGNLFDFNHDGKLDALEQGMEFVALQQMLDEEDNDEDEIDDFELDDFMND